MDPRSECDLGQPRSFFSLPSFIDLKLTSPPQVSIHAAVFDYEGKEPRHGTRVSSLAEVPYFDPKSPTRREALGFDKPEDFEGIGQRKEIQY